LNVVDIAGLVRGASEGQGLGNAFLSHIRACDALFHMSSKFRFVFFIVVHSVIYLEQNGMVWTHVLFASSPILPFFHCAHPRPLCYFPILPFFQRAIPLLSLLMMRRGKEFANAPSASSLSGVTVMTDVVSEIFASV
jgi:hypothetical protein